MSNDRIDGTITTAEIARAYSFGDSDIRWSARVVTDRKVGANGRLTKGKPGRSLVATSLTELFGTLREIMLEVGEDELEVVNAVLDDPERWRGAPVRGAVMIDDERRRQVEEEGYTAEHDDDHLSGDFIAAARGYLTAAYQQIGHACGWTEEMVEEIVLEHDALVWPWDSDDFKPSDDPMRNLVKAGALIAAEIDRLQRSKANE